MTTARDLMTPNPTCVRTSDTVLAAARAMATEDVGALPIRGEDNREGGCRALAARQGGRRSARRRVD